MNNKINRVAYLNYARKFTEKEKDLILEFQEWLPDTIIDCHAHCNLEEHVHSIDDRAYNHMLSTFPSFSLEESKEWHGLFFPGKEIRSLRFPKTFRGIDHKIANLYLLEKSDSSDRVALYGLPNDPEYTIEMLVHPRVSALKMYYSYIEPPATEIYQYFPQAILEVAQDYDIPIILHPPTKITTCLDQILQLLNDFPRLRVCIAHLGLTKSVIPGLREAFTLLSRYSQISFDTALAPSLEVLAMALETIGINRIMFGSDQPLNLIRSTSFMHPDLGERLVTEYPYHWVNKLEHNEYKHLSVGLNHSHWQTLQAIKSATSAFSKKDQKKVKQNLFHDNAKLFYKF